MAIAGNVRSNGRFSIFRSCRRDRRQGSIFRPGQQRWGGFYYRDISNTALLTRLKANNEVGGELFYSLGIIPALHAAFDLQAVSSARPRQETALILGGRVAVNF